MRLPVRKAGPSLIVIQPHQLQRRLQSACRFLAPALGRLGNPMNDRNRARRIQIVAQRRQHFGIGLARSRDIVQHIGKIHQRRARLRQPLHRPIDGRAIVRAKHRQAAHFSRPALPAELIGRNQLVDGDEVAERFRHLLPFDLQKAVVHPHVGHHLRIVGATRLGNLVFVMGEHEIDPATMNIECIA